VLNRDENLEFSLGFVRMLDEVFTRTDCFSAELGSEKSDSVVLWPDAAMLVKEYADVFPDELTDGLSLKRNVDHRIIIKPGQKPASKAPYGVSIKELEKLKLQLMSCRKVLLNQVCDKMRSQHFLLRKREMRLYIDKRPVLKQPDYTKPFSILSDPSQHGIGSVLVQLEKVRMTSMSTIGH